MSRNYKIEPFVRLGAALRESFASDRGEALMRDATTQNPWFTEESIRTAVEAICMQMLSAEALQRWLSHYDEPTNPAQRVGVILAGNLPLVGFFDLLCVWVAGHHALIKPSSKDRVLVDYICELLEQIDPTISFEHLTPETQPDALIATGGEEANRYFEATYHSTPSLLRSERHSVAVLDSETTPTELLALWEDTFTHCGLGCRNVSHLLVPRNFELERVVQSWGDRPLTHPKYLSNYRQQRALLTLSGTPFLDGGYFVLGECKELRAPLATIHYHRYDTPHSLRGWLTEHDPQIQCVVSTRGDLHPRGVRFGSAQRPRLDEYADGVDTLQWLNNL